MIKLILSLVERLSDNDKKEFFTQFCLNNPDIIFDLQNDLSSH